MVSGNGNDGAAITIRELLQHTSGIYDFTEALPALASRQGYLDSRYRSATPEQLVAIAMRHRPLFKPGTSWAYSNTDYVLAGMIIAKATGQSWAAEVYDRIIAPLGLRHTFVPGAWPYLPAPHADLYQQFTPGGPLTDTTVMNYTWADAAGAIVSTPDDLDRFFRALISGRLLPPAQLAEMEETVPTIGEQGLLDRYGLGLGWQPLSCGGGYWTHGGDVHGDASPATRYLDRTEPMSTPMVPPGRTPARAARAVRSRWNRNSLTFPPRWRVYGSPRSSACSARKSTRPKSQLDRLGSQDRTSGSISRRRAGITCAKLWI